MTAIEQDAPRQHRSGIAVGFLTCMLLWIALIVLQSYGAHRQRMEQQVSGLGFDSVGWEPVSLWQQRPSISELALHGGHARDSNALDSGAPAPDPGQMIVRTGLVRMLAREPNAAAEALRRSTYEMGGYVVASRNADASGGTAGAQLELRVPSDHFDHLRMKARGLGTRVLEEVTRSREIAVEHADLSARIRNARAEEAQYLGILRQARKVSDILEVSAKLTTVRERIEKMEAERRRLEHTVDTSLLEVTMEAESTAEVLGVYWRPLHQFKLAINRALRNLTYFAEGFLAIALHLPIVLFWLVSLILGFALVGRVVGATASWVLPWMKKGWVTVPRGR